MCLVPMMGGGCIFSPDRGKGQPPPPPVVYPERNTPKNAVTFLALAWSNRNSDLIDTVYAEDYLGTSNDLTDPNSQPLAFSITDEVKAVRRMELSQTIQKVEMDFGLQEGWIETHYVSDPPDWRSVQIPSIRIYVNDTVLGEYSAKSPGLGETWIFEFTMRPTYQNGPGGAPVYEIVRWVESRATL